MSGVRKAFVRRDEQDEADDGGEGRGPLNQSWGRIIDQAKTARTDSRISARG
jgi:hypothetical protein